MERLINYFIPENYNLELRINKQTEAVQGHVIISGKLQSDSLKLHARDLRISKVLIDEQEAVFKFDSEKQLLNINLPKLNQIQNLDQIKDFTIIDIHYSFKLSHSMIGMYLSTYQYQGEEERIVST